jgi:hypothetical protein
MRRTWIAPAVLGIALSVAAPAGAAVTPRWHRYQVPVEGKANLVGVAAVARDDAWAAGFLVKISGSAARRAKALTCFGQNAFPSLMLRWNGHTWRQVQVPNVGRINYLSASSSTDVWASADCGLLHWDGHQWTQVSYATMPAQQNSQGDIKTLGAKDAWLVGGTYDNRTQVSRGFVQRWDGRQWHIVRLPALGDDFSLDSIDVRSPRDVWAVGTDYTGNTSHAEPLVLLHWNGRSWKRLPSPPTGEQTNRLSKVGAFAANDVWIAGWGKTKPDWDQPRRPLMLHWDGRRWSSAPAPAGPGELYDVARDRRTLLATGDTFSPANPSFTMYALRWTGSHWTPGPVPATGPGSVSALAPIPGGGMWGVGAVGDNNPYPVIARLG